MNSREIMSGFTFGTQGATSTVTPVAGSLFGATSKPVKGNSTGAIQSAGAGFFGAPTSLAVASTTPAGGLMVTAEVATTSVVGGPSGTTSVTTAATSTPSLFGILPATTVTGSLFGKPATSLFSSPAVVTTTLTGGIFNTSGVPTTVTGIGLGGTGTLVATGLTSSNLGVAGSAASGSPLETEVQQVVMDLFNLLRDQIKKNHELSVEFTMNSSESCLSLDEKIEELIGTRMKNADFMRKTKGRAEDLLEKMQGELRAAEQVRRRQKEISKNSHFGRKQAFSYLLAVCTEHENTVREFRETLQLLQERINSKLNKKDITTKKDLQKHFEHYDQAFKVICCDVYQCKTQIEDLKDAFLEYQKRTVPYAPNPFERRKSKHTEKSFGERKFTGADAFPSQITMMKIGELARPSSTTQQTTGLSAFGTSGSLFGSKNFGGSAFSFNPSVSNTTAPLFKPFPTTTGSASLFGPLTTQAAEPVIPSTTASFTFGNTLNSSVSGTLFGGSTIKPFGK